MKNGEVKHPTIAFRGFSKAPKTVPIIRSDFHIDLSLWDADSDSARIRPGYARIPRKRRNNLKGDSNDIDDNDIG
jgi:hypothetical protein